MIFIDRSQVPRPKWFGSADWRGRLARLAEHLQDPGSQRRATDIMGLLPPEAVEAVWQVFDGRCAMCESTLAMNWTDSALQFAEKLGSIPIKRFWPVGSTKRHAYTGTALLWENLILLCSACDRARGDRFLVQFGQPLLRLPQAGGRTYSLLENAFIRLRLNEVPFQLDPTYDKPTRHLYFTAKGEIKAISERGAATIQTFNLDRQELQAGRKKSVDEMAALLRGLPEPPFLREMEASSGVARAAAYFNRYLPLVTPDFMAGEYQAANSACIVRWLRTWMQNVPLTEVLARANLPELDLAHARRLLLPVWETEDERLALRGEIKLETTGHAILAPSYSPIPWSTSRVKSVRLINYRQFQDAFITLPPERQEEANGLHRELRDLLRDAEPDGEKQPPEPSNSCGWKMLLGENGVGKSSVLQALALALLADSESIEAARAHPWCNLCDSLSAGATQGHIEVEMEDHPGAPIVLTFTASEVSLRARPAARAPMETGPRPRVYLRGYGATRLMPSSPPRLDMEGVPKSSQDQQADASGPPAKPPDPQPQDTRNLFDPHHPLGEPNAWLGCLDDEARRQAFITLKDLLDLPAAARLVFEKHGQGPDTLMIHHGGQSTPLVWLSAGYQSVVALACDIMAGFGREVGDMQKRTGLVLLDEIGTNLHPRWRLRIVQALRRAFPRLQFIATTHEPLCLRGLGQDEVCVLTRDLATHKVIITDEGLPSPATLRVDQLLTSDLFGLQTAQDPDEEAAFDLYHSLLVAERAGFLAEAQARLLDKMRDILPTRLALGGTPFEQRALSMVEEKIYEQHRSAPVVRAEAARLLRDLGPGTSTHESP